MEGQHKFFSWHYGDVALSYAWIILIAVSSFVSAFQNLNQKWQITIAAYNYWINTIVTGSVLFITEWRLGQRYNIPALFVKPVMFAISISYYYYYMKQSNMYLEAYMVSFFMFIFAIPIWHYGPGLIPKRPGRKARRLPPVIK